MNATCESDMLEEVMEADEQQESADAYVEEDCNQGAVCPPSSPVQMNMPDMPTFCLMYVTAITNFWMCILIS